MNHVTVGVAGHIDHGKTALVEALTGIDTDRLKEEKERGMSIVLGFAHLCLPEGEVDLIDVPGHEKFLKTMIAGATGVEAVLLVIAANEVVKPQTVEHLELAALLGVKAGLVAITKSDLAAPEERELIALEVREFLRGTFLENAPVVFTSVVSGEGLNEVKSRLRALLDRAAPPPNQPFFYLPVDRVFTMAGYGTVATGTLRRGALRVGQSVEILPGGARAEVRGLEVHNRQVERAEPGWRTAVNLRGIKKGELLQGDALATPGFLRPTRLLDAELRLLGSVPRPLRNGQPVRLYHGTKENLARVCLLDREELAPGETGLVQFRLREELVVPHREPYILRTYSPIQTIGGGLLVDANPQRHGRFDEGVISRVRTLSRGNASEMLIEKLLEAGIRGREVSRLIQELGLSPDQLERELAELPVVLCSGGLALHRTFFHNLRDDALDQVNRFHAAHPTQRGIPREALRQKLPAGLKPAAFNRVLEELVRGAGLEIEDSVVKAAGFTSEAMLSPADREAARDIERLFKRGGFKPPGLEEVIHQDKRRKTLYHYLVQTRVLINTTDQTNNRTIVFHRDALSEAERLLEEHFARADGFSIAQANGVLNTTRKYAIPLLEYLDSLGTTKRVGDRRVWNRERR